MTKFEDPPKQTYSVLIDFTVEAEGYREAAQIVDRVLPAHFKPHMYVAILDGGAMHDQAGFKPEDLVD